MIYALRDGETGEVLAYLPTEGAARVAARALLGLPPGAAPARLEVSPVDDGRASGALASARRGLRADLDRLRRRLSERHVG